MTAIDIKEWKQWRKGEGCGEAKKDGCRSIRQCNHLNRSNILIQKTDTTQP